MKTGSKKEIIASLMAQKFLSEASLEEMGNEIKKTSSCVIVDANNFKPKSVWGVAALYNDAIGFDIETCPPCDFIQARTSFKKFKEEIIASAFQLDEGDGVARKCFAKNARKLAKMLLNAAKEIEMQD